MERICVCVRALKGVRIMEAVGSQCTSQQFFDGGVGDPVLFWMAMNCNNIVNVDQLLVKQTEVFLPDAKEPEPESNDIASGRALQDMWLVGSNSRARS